MYTRPALIAMAATLLAAAACGADTKPPGQRVSALGVPVRFTVPGTSARVVMGPRSTVVLHGSEAGKPPAVEVEEGAALVSAPQGANLAVHGKGLSIVLSKGSVVYTRDVLTRDERLLLIDGEALAPIQGGQVQVPRKNALVVPGVGTGDASITAELPAVVERLEKFAAATGESVVDLPGTAVPGPGAPPAASSSKDLQVAPLTAGTMIVALPADRPTLATDQITAQRQRLLVGLPDTGSGGPGFFLDFLTMRPGRVRNVLCTGSSGFVRFFYSPQWLATLAPGSVLDAEGPDLRSQDRAPSRLRLVRGAMLVHGRETALPDGLGLSELGATDLPVAEAGAPAMKEIVVAAREPADASTPSEVLLARARAALAPVLALPILARAGSAPAPNAPRAPVLMTILTDLPMPPENLIKYIPLHTAPQAAIDKLALTMLGPPPAASDAVGGLVTRPGRRGEPVPVAVVMPSVLAEQNGPQPSTFGAFLVRQNLDLWTLRRMADDQASRVGVVAQTDVHVKTRADPRTLLLLVVAVLLGSIPGVRQRIMGFLELIPGLARAKCRRCGLVLDVYPIGEFRLDEDHEPLIELLRYDMISEVVRQEKARALILDRIRLKDTPADKTKFRFRGGWCQRCLSGSILSEIVQNGEVVDETDWEVASADTHKLLKMIKNPARAQELLKE